MNQPPAHLCLLHADFHPLTDECLAAVVRHSLTHPLPFTTAARADYEAAVERAMLDRHIREHRATTLLVPVAAVDPDGERVPVPDDDDWEQAA